MRPVERKPLFFYHLFRGLSLTVKNVAHGFLTVDVNS